MATGKKNIKKHEDRLKISSFKALSRHMGGIAFILQRLKFNKEGSEQVIAAIDQLKTFVKTVEDEQNNESAS